MIDSTITFNKQVYKIPFRQKLLPGTLTKLGRILFVSEVQPFPLGELVSIPFKVFTSVPLSVKWCATQLPVCSDGGTDRWIYRYGDDPIAR